MSGFAGCVPVLLRALAPVCVLIVAFAGVTHAEWSNDPAVNLPIADRTSEQVLPIPAETSDGGCYIGWFDLSSGNYNVMLQRLDRNGVEQWAHNGIVVSAHPQETWLVAWDMMTDRDDNAILVFSDIREGIDRDVFAYKVSPAGELLWGPDGIALSRNDVPEPGACVTQATDGDLVFAWARMPEAGAGTIQMQRVTPDGVPRFPLNGITVVAPATERPAFPDLVPSLDGSVMLSWVRDISTYMSPRHFRACRYRADGTAAWSPVAIFELAPIPMGYAPTIQSDHAGGLVCVCHASVSGYFTSRFQRITPEGLEICPHNGLPVATTSMQHVDPTLAYHADTREAYVFWNERDYDQVQRGIYGQRISAGGSRLWGDAGRECLPLDDEYKNFPRAVPFTEGAMVFLSKGPAPTVSEQLFGFAVDETGAMLWPGSPITVSSVYARKARYPVVITRDEMAIVVWEDDRNGTVDLFAQNVNADGTLGRDPTAVAAADVPPLALTLAPNPFSSSTRLALQLPAGHERARMVILDASGRVMHGLDLAGPGGGVGRAQWDGTSSRGRLPAGVYFYRIEGAAGSGRIEGRIVLTE